jgi:hypothetical protein
VVPDLLWEGNEAFMHKLLVPIQDFSGLSLSATYFAIEFAKRNPAKIFFLIFSAFPKSKEGFVPPLKKGDLRRNQFEDLLDRAREEKINLEIFYSNEDFYEVTSQFFKDHSLTEIIVALPSETDPAYPKVMDRVGQLRNSLESQLIIVKPKEEKIMAKDWEKPKAEQPQTPKSRPPSGKKGS